MLSTEKPPPDPSCSCQTSQPNTNNCCNNISWTDEKASDKLDLLESGFDDDNNNPFPNFSFCIRDYVFSTREKDIQTNWPFSLENLQLALKHGVKDVLPPFQSLDAVRNLPVVKSAVESTSDSDVKLSSELTDRISCHSHNDGQELVVNIDSINTSGSEEDKEFPSTTTSQSCSDTNPIPPIKRPLLGSQAENLTGLSSRNQDFAIPAPNKVKTNIRTQVKKCRLVVKLGNSTELKLNEDLGLNSCAISETMTSKVCPVCKTFSSSSNTTLNAHIDQCLSVGSTTKWTTSSKVIKHRIKPRKTKLMVDIYETALQYNLEDLDRRNGTNWASSLAFPAPQDLEACAEEKNNIHSSCNMEDYEEGAVYIDSNGTKLCILSKLSDLPHASSSNAKDDSGPRKLVKRDIKGNKLPSSKKKKNIGQRYELEKGAPSGQQNCVPWSDHHSSTVFDGQDGDRNENQTLPPKAYDQSKLYDMGIIKQWVGSKRTGLKKKISIIPENQHPDKTMENFRMKNMSSEGDTFNTGISDSNSPISDVNSLSSTEICKRKEQILCDSRSECVEQNGRRKRVGFSVLASQECRGNKNGVFSKDNKKRSRKNAPSFNERFVNPPNGTENQVRPCIKKSVNINSVLNTEDCFISSKLSGPHAFSSRGKVASPQEKSFNQVFPSGCKKFSSSKNNMLSVKHESVRGSKMKLKKKHLHNKKSRLRESSESDKDVVMMRCVVNRQNNLVETPSRHAGKREIISDDLFLKRNGVLRTRKNRRGFANKGGIMASKRSAAPYQERNIRGVGKNMVTFMSSNVPNGIPDALNELGAEKAFSCNPMSDGEDFVAFSKSLGPTFPDYAGSSDVECTPQHYAKTYEGDGSAELMLGGEQDMYCSDNIDPDFTLTNNEMNGDGQGNYFVDVDPIPIPGPPGSFLPSPGRLGSEELQGNSSLTTFKLHSSEDEHEPVDMYSLDSPVSAASMVSNSVPARPGPVSFVNLSVPSHNIEHEAQRGFSEERIDPAAESPIPFERACSEEEKADHDESRANVMSHHEMNAPIFKNGESSCLSKDEGAFQDSSSFQDSQFLLKRTTVSFPSPFEEIQTIGGNSEPRVVFDLRSHETTKRMPNSAVRYASFPISQNSKARFPTCDLESPSASNPVLRLMGKNLMVASKDENLSAQTRSPTQSSVVINHPDLGLRADTGIFPNQHLSVHHTSSRVPVVLLDDKNITSSPQPPYNFAPSNRFKVPHNFSMRPPQDLQDPQAVTLQSERSGKKHMEIIVIGDHPLESAACLGIKLSRGDVMEMGGVPARMSFGYADQPMHVSSNSCSYQIPRGSANIQTPLSLGVSGNPGKGICNLPQVSSQLPLHHPNSSKVSSPAKAQLRSPLYFTPGFSHPTSFSQ